MLRTWNSTFRFSKFILKKEIYEKFEEFLFKLVWRETLFHREAHMSGVTAMFVHLEFYTKLLLIHQSMVWWTL